MRYVSIKSTRQKETLILFVYKKGLGNISGTMTPSSLQAIFSRFGTVESVRVLSHKNCGFVNFELVESAVAARNALVQNETGAQEFAGVRVGFAKVPPPKSPDVNDESRANQVLDTNDIWLKDLSAIMVQLGIESSHAQHFVRGKEKIKKNRLHVIKI